MPETTVPAAVAAFIDRQKKIVQRIMAMFLATNQPATQTATTLEVLFDDMNQALTAALVAPAPAPAPGVDPALEAELAQLHHEIENAGVMATNNFAGEEARRANAAHEAPTPIPPYTPDPTDTGTPTERVERDLQDVIDIEKSTNFAPPAPPKPVDA